MHARGETHIGPQDLCHLQHGSLSVQLQALDLWVKQSKGYDVHEVREGMLRLEVGKWTTSDKQALGDRRPGLFLPWMA